MNTKIEIAEIILWATTEDYTGLWDLLWEINTEFPTLSVSERKSLLSEVLQLLLEKGFVKLYIFHGMGGNFSELDLGIALAALVEEKNWEPPADLTSVHIRAGVTPLGEKLYQSDTVSSLY